MSTDPRDYLPSHAMQSIIGNYIPSLDDIQNSALTLKSTVVDIVKGRNSSAGAAVHTVTFMKFEQWTSHNYTHLYLIIGTSTGFQVFLLHDSRDRESSAAAAKSNSQPPSSRSTSNLHNINTTPPTNIANIAAVTSNHSPILSAAMSNNLFQTLTNSPRNSPSIGAVNTKRKKFHKRALTAQDNLEIIKVAPGGGKQQRQIPTPISCATILKEAHKWDGPILAVSPANEAHNFDSKCVRLYSLMEQQYVHVHRLRTKVHGIFSRPTILLIVSEKEITAINPTTDETLFRKTCAPNPMHGVVADLGARWMAYADTKTRAQCATATHLLPRTPSQGHGYPASMHAKTKKNKHKNKNHHKSPQKQKQKQKHENAEHKIGDNQNKNKNNENDENDDDDEFGGFDTHTQSSATTTTPSRHGYDMMASQLMTMAESTTKHVTHTFSTLSEASMKFLGEKVVETRKQVQKQQQHMKRKRDELRLKNEHDKKAQAASGSGIGSYFQSAATANNSLYCDDPPSQGIVSILDIATGEVVLNFVAHATAPLMHVRFDPSGALLVTADRDGIYLHIWQIVGYPTQHATATAYRAPPTTGHGGAAAAAAEDGVQQSQASYTTPRADDGGGAGGGGSGSVTVHRQLYRIYRGFRYAIIRDISFSQDSKWMAVSSARGTIHLYAIEREGGVPSYATHNLLACDVADTRVLRALSHAYDVESVDAYKVLELQSQRKLHHDMKETRKDSMGATTTAGGTKIAAVFSFLGQSEFGRQALLVQTPIAFHQYGVSTCGGSGTRRRRRRRTNDADHEDDEDEDDDAEDGDKEIVTSSTATSSSSPTTTATTTTQRKLQLEIDALQKFSSRDLYHAQSVSYPYLHDQLYPQSTPSLQHTSQLYPMQSATMSVFNLDDRAGTGTGTPQKTAVETSGLSSSRTFDADTKRWLSHTELLPINRFHEVSLWGNPQFNFYSYAAANADTKMNAPRAQEHDAYAFLDTLRMSNATPIKLHDDSPIVGPRPHQPQIEVQTSDLQGTIDNAMESVIDEPARPRPPQTPLRLYDDDDSEDGDDDGEFDRQIPIPRVPANVAHKSISSSSAASNEKDKEHKNAILSLNLMDDYGQYKSNEQRHDERDRDDDDDDDCDEHDIIIID